MKRKRLFATASLLGIVLLAGCGQTGAETTNEETSGTATETTEVTTITVAHTQNAAPMDYVDENGESKGYEVSVLKAIDELLPQYEFEYVGTADEDLLIGVESGKYDVGTKGAWYTEERAQKFIFPENYIGASSIGVLIRSEDAEKITDLESFAAAGKSLVPISPNNAQYNVIADFNAEHPDTPIDLIPADTFEIADAYTWLLEGRYDGFFAVKTAYEANVLAEGAPYSQYKDDFSYFVYEALPTWPLFNKDQQALADAYDEAFVQLEDDGTIDKLMNEFIGENTFQYVKE